MNTEIRQFLDDLFSKAASDEYIFRGEPAHYAKVSSGLCRLLENTSVSFVDKIAEIEQRMVEAAKSYANLSERSDEAVLSELQHFGGKTNLIDFSRDCLIALFFACGQPSDQHGRIICLNRTSDEYDIVNPAENHSRVIAQKSIFVKSPNGIVASAVADIIDVPSDMKPTLRSYLERVHGISHPSIYTDIVGFVALQNMLLEGYLHLSSQSAAGPEGDAISDMPDWLKMLTPQSS